MTTAALQTRKTFGYVGTYRHLDQWEDIGEVIEISTRELPCANADDICEPHKRQLNVRVKRDPGVTDKQVVEALNHTYTSAGCAHDYDCCGCRSHYVERVKNVGGDLFHVTISSSRNY